MSEGTSEPMRIKIVEEPEHISKTNINVRLVHAKEEDLRQHLALCAMEMEELGDREPPKVCPRFIALVEYLYTLMKRWGWSRPYIVSALAGLFCRTKQHIRRLLRAIEKTYGESGVHFTDVSPTHAAIISRIRDPDARRQMVEQVKERGLTEQETYKAVQMLTRKKKPIRDVKVATDIARKRAEATANTVTLVFKLEPEAFEELEAYRKAWLKKDVKEFIVWVVRKFIRDHPLP